MKIASQKSVVISQPMYFPWPGFMQLMKAADVFIWLDDAQFSKGSFGNRVQIRLPQGVVWMTIPVVSNAQKTFLDLTSSNSTWKNSHRELIKQAYRESQFFGFANEIVDKVFSQVALVDLIISSAEECARAVGALPVEIHRSSNLKVEGRGWQRVLDLVKLMGGSRYITAHGAVNYLDHQEFESNGVRVEYIDYEIAHWPQANGEFNPFVSSLDLISESGETSSKFISVKTNHYLEFLKIKGNAN